MGFFATLLGGGALKALVDALLGPAELIFRDYLNAKISKDQLAEKMGEAVLAAFAQVEISFYDSITKTYASFMQTMAQNARMQVAWSFVLYTQLAVLVWHQVGIPAIDYIFGIRYPSSGATVDWAYALVALCLGAPAIASRIGPAAGALSDSLKRLVGK